MLEKAKLLGRLLTVIFGWLYLAIVWLFASVWIISPLLWVQLDLQSLYILLGRSLWASTLLCPCLFLCDLTSSKERIPSCRPFHKIDFFRVLETIWLYIGVLFVLLTLSSALLLGYWVLTKPS
ncbi:MAG: hypothetical protein KatS3mg019_0567 [Fimbriimonadales bacterium]|nr:MAG: hypothetical protein KatS3mg019_0567 [Fimbriimonadales bacterium]